MSDSQINGQALAFSSLALKPQLLATLDSIGYTGMTAIQAQSLPLVLAERDVIAQGKTGSGKTAAFALGLLNKLNVKRFRIQSLVLCPTRELADQVAKEIRTLARGIHNIKVLTLCGGVPVGPQIGSLEHGAHIIVGTPGRVLDHLQQGRLDFSELTTLVLDEADRMLEMGFTQAMDSIIAMTPANRQTLLFSATFPAQIQGMAERIMHQPEMVKVAATHDSQSISQQFFHLESKAERMKALQILLCKYQPESAVVFCNTKRETQAVADELAALGFSALALHGDQEQRERDRTLVQFANKSINILVATDVAARGLDIDNLDAVVNFEMAYDSEVHIHRIGRTGRAGSQGQAFSFYTGKDSLKVAALEDILGAEIQDSELPSEQYLDTPPYRPKMTTILIDGGKKQKLRPGDILGALTADKSLTGDDIGKIKITDIRSFVAVKRQFGKKALTILNKGKLKGRQFRAFSVY